MLIRFYQDFGAYLYDVFWTNLNSLAIFGILSQLLFGARFIVQWIASERAGRSVVPMAFWVFSIAGGMLTLAYGLAKREPVIILGQSLSVVIYVRNIVLTLRERRRSALGATTPPRAGRTPPPRRA